jgi:hypothetical protein
MQKIIRTTRGANDPQIKALLNEGWRITATHSQSQGYDAGKTCCLGCLFLPLALLGKKQDVVEYVLEKNEVEAAPKPVRSGQEGTSESALKDKNKK